MSNINDKATVELFVNGENAEQSMDRLRKKADELRNALDKATTPKEKKKLQKELDRTEKELSRVESAAKGVGVVLNKLSETSIHGLRNALKHLQKELTYAKPNSEAWHRYAEQIEQVKGRIEELNEELEGGQSLWGKFKDWAEDTWPAVDLLSRGYDSVVSGLREYVDAYAGMDQEMASVRKFTGMTEEEVASLNEEFKKIDTRSSREQLNQLAQEAGRLGKTSEEDVLGFVRAADKINVALDDLGDGATLTLSKLTGIFGDEEKYGTEQSLLKVGSVINELSQNCSASAPYIADFTERLGGVGAQANMTIPQIMGFAAVLDTNAQKVEASATALSQIIVRLYQDPAKYAKVVGLDAQEFASLMREDANAALILFLETLQKAGGMDKLSPMFKDMGEKGSRAIVALSTLATHIENVKAQQEAANIAFEEGTSIDKEFAVQNGTVQAGLDKCKKAANELRVKLGSYLAPIMGHFLTTSAAIMRVILTVIKFLVEQKVAVIAIASSTAAYLVIAKLHALWLDRIALKTMLANKWSKIWAVTQKTLSGVSAVVRLAIAAVTNAVSYFTKGLQVNYTMQERWRKAMEAMKFTNWAGLILAVAGAVYALASRWNESRKAAEEARKEAEEYRRKLTDLDEVSSGYCANEIARLDALYKEATDEAKSTDKRREAAEKLQKLYPDYFKDLSTEEIMVGRARNAYDQLRDSIIEVARARAAAEKIAENEKELLTLEQQAPGLMETRDRDKAAYDAAVAEWENARQQEQYMSNASGSSTEAAANYAVDVAPYARRVASTGETYNASEAAYQENQRKQRQLNEVNKFLHDKYKISAEALMEPKTPSLDLGGGGGGDGDGTTTTALTDKFAAEKDWRAQAEASARISYATGETDYLAYTERMNEIAVEFYEKQLMHTDLSETERLQITAQWREAQLKAAQQGEARSLEVENNSYNERMAELKQFNIDGQISKETFDQRSEELELEHQQNIVNAYKEANKDRVQTENDGYEQRRSALEQAHSQGLIEEALYLAQVEELERIHQANLAAIRSEEIEAERRLQDLRVQQTQRRQAETLRLEQEYAQMKKDYFGDNPLERQEKYDSALANLDVVYQRELAAAGDNAAEKLRIEEAYQQAKLVLQRQYGLAAEEDTRNSMERAVAASAEWLNGDGGKALTGALSTVTSGMSSIFSGLSTLIQAELQIQTAQIEKKYDREIELAQGNSYKVAKLERKKEKEIAKAKNEANRKMFAMQVIQAVAQTATNALSAYGSAAAVPVIGYILAPIAAAMAVAAGAIQIAAIKKQQQASEAQGYSQGGFTGPGGVNDPAGIVHRGEWVASQKLLANPVARPMIEALDYAQRTNTIGSLRADDVSRSITANDSLVRMAESDNGAVILSAAAAQMSGTVAALNDRLKEPFVTVNTVTGDKGIKSAQDEYDRLMNNITPKSKRK